MDASLSVADFGPLVPLNGISEDIRRLLLPYARSLRIAARAAINVNFSQTPRYMIEGSVDVRTSDGFVSSFTAGPKERFPLAPEQPAMVRSRSPPILAFWLSIDSESIQF